jgi:hypothetical protein
MAFWLTDRYEVAPGCLPPNNIWQLQSAPAFCGRFFFAGLCERQARHPSRSYLPGLTSRELMFRARTSADEDERKGEGKNGNDND